MIANQEKLIEIYNGLEEEEKLIFKELLDDILFFDISRKREKINKTSLEEKYFNNKYKEKLTNVLYNTSIKKYGKKATDNRIKNFLNILIKDLFGTDKLGNYNKISNLATNKIKGFNNKIKILFDKNKLNLLKYHGNRKILLDYFYQYNLVIRGLKSNIFDFKESVEYINELESRNHRDPLNKLLAEILSKNKEVFGTDNHNNGINELSKLDEKINTVRYDEKQVIELINKIKDKKEYKLEYDRIEKILIYNGEEVHNFKGVKENDLKMNILDIVFKYNVGVNIKFNKLYSLYGIENYYIDINNVDINKKIKSTIGKINILIKEKTLNNQIKLLSQEKDGDNLYLFRNI